MPFKMAAVSVKRSIDPINYNKEQNSCEPQFLGNENPKLRPYLLIYNFSRGTNSVSFIQRSVSGHARLDLILIVAVYNVCDAKLLELNCLLSNNPLVNR